MSHVGDALAVSRRNGNHFIVIGHSHRCFVVHDQIGDAFVGALVLPQHLSGLGRDRGYAVWAAFYRLAVLQARELATYARIQNAVCQNQFRRNPEVFRLPGNLAGDARDGPDVTAARSVDERFVGHRCSFGQGQTFLVHPKLFAGALAAVACVVRSHSFIKEIETPVGKERWMIIVQAVGDIVLLAPTGWHHFDFAEFVLPQFVAGSQIQDMHHRLSFEAVIHRTLRIFSQDDGQQICLRLNRHVHDGAAQLVALPDAITVERVDRFDTRPRSFLETQQQHVRAGNRSDVILIE